MTDKKRQKISNYTKLSIINLKETTGQSYGDIAIESGLDRSTE